MLLFKMGGNQDSWNYGWISLTRLPEKLLEQIINQSICKNLEDERVITSCRHGLIKNKQCQTNFISFFDGVNSLVDKGNVVDLIHLNFTKTFEAVLCGLFQKVKKCGLATIILGRYRIGCSKQVESNYKWINARQQGCSKLWVVI